MLICKFSVLVRNWANHVHFPEFIFTHIEKRNSMDFMFVIFKLGLL